MPTPPHENETQDKFISRCVSYLRDEGKSQEQALGQCFGLWNQRHKTNESVKKRIRKSGKR